MAEPDLQTLFREVLEELAGEDGDMGYMHESLPRLSAFIRDFAAPDFVCAMCPMPPARPTEFPGVEGIERAWQDYGAAFEAVRVQLSELHESDAHVVAMVDQRATTRHGGVPISQPSAIVFQFGDGQVKRVEFHVDQAEALRVAGLR